MGFINFIFGSKKRQVEGYLKKGAIILDVRTKKEWDNGHIENAMHIPLDDLHNRVDDLKKLNKPIITCCQSGVRSGKAAQFLNLNNLEAINGGGWASLKRKLCNYWA